MKYLFMPAIKRTFFLIIFMLILSSYPEVIAQTENAELNESGDAGDDPDIPNIPIDGGLSFLLVAGAAYGGKKVINYRNRKMKNQSNENSG